MSRHRKLTDAEWKFDGVSTVDGSGRSHKLPQELRCFDCASCKRLIVRSTATIPVWNHIAIGQLASWTDGGNGHRRPICTSCHQIMMNN